MPFAPYPLAVERRDDRLWRLTRRVVYTGRDETFEVPVYYLTDFASVPRFVTWLVPTTGRWTEASVLHDWFCEHGIADGQVSAVDCDGIFRRIMREQGVPWLLRWIIWLGIRWGAAASPVRRTGWWRTAHIVIPASLVLAPVLAPAILLVLATLGVVSLAGAAARLVGLR